MYEERKWGQFWFMLTLMLVVINAGIVLKKKKKIQQISRGLNRDSPNGRINANAISIFTFFTFTKQWICLCLFCYSSNFLWERTSRIHCQCCFTLRFTKDSSSVQKLSAPSSDSKMSYWIPLENKRIFLFSELLKFQLCCLPLERRRE